MRRLYEWMYNFSYKRLGYFNPITFNKGLYKKNTWYKITLYTKQHTDPEGYSVINTTIEEEV